MRPEFRERLLKYSEYAKAPQLSEDDQLELQILFEEGDEPAQQEIYLLQAQKQMIMDQLHENLRNIDDPKYQPERPPNSHMIYYNEAKGGYYIQKKSEREILSLGDVMNQFNWQHEGELVLDPKSVPRQFRKRFAIERAKSGLRNLANQQILSEELSRKDLHPERRKAYEAIQQRSEEHLPSGVVAERVVQNLMNKLSYDFPELGLQITPTDAHQDVVEKVDFVMARSNRQRGVKVEDSKDNKIRRYGIQFTTDTSWEGQRKKEDQLARARKKLDASLEDIVLVTIPAGKVMRIYHEWQRKRSYGGPEIMLDREMQAEIFSATMEGFLPKEEIDQVVEKIKGVQAVESHGAEQPNQSAQDQTRLTQLRTELKGV